MSSSRSPNEAAKMSLQNRGRLLKVGQHPRGVGGVLFRRPLERFDLRWLQREAPMEVNPPKARGFLEEGQPVVGKHLRHGASVQVPPRKIEARHDAGVLVEAGAFRQAAQRAFY